MAINNVNNAGQKPQLESQRLNQQQSQQGQNTKNAQQAQTASTAGIARQDSVSLTQSAQQLTNVQKKGNDAPVNQEKVDRLKSAIQSGEYKIDPEKLAGNIARTESQLFGETKR